MRNRLDETYRRTEVEQRLHAPWANAERTGTFWGKLTGRHQAAQEEAETLTLNLASIRQREAEQTAALERQIQAERQAMEARRAQLEPAPERQQAPERGQTASLSGKSLPRPRSHRR